MWLTFKIICTFFFSQILLPGRLARSYFNVVTVAFKLLIYQCLVVKWQLLFGCSITINSFRELQHEFQFFLFLWIANFSHLIRNIELWRIMGKEKKWTYEIRCLDWIELIDGYWLVNNNWRTGINWPNHLTCSS